MNEIEKSDLKNIAEQKKVLMTGNELVAEAARVIDFHFMGYYPITPSTEIAQLVDAMKVRGEVGTVLLAADGEHGAAGACFGASTGGARVLNATSANGLLYSLEQLPVQAGSRWPMVLNLVTRSVSGPLDIRCDHSDLMFALQTGWIILLASTPQAVYDMNILAVKLGEHPDVRLPVMVVSDGFFTSHQRQSAQIFSDKKVVQEFLGIRQDPFTTLDPKNPITVGPYMNDPDLINNKYQLHLAHEKAAIVFNEISKEYFKLSGRYYPALETYKMEESDPAVTALFIINSAAETAKDAVDNERAKGKAVGVIKPNILRPFPMEELQKVTHNLSSLVIAERGDTPGSVGGPLSHEVRSALLADRHCNITALSRIFGIGGKDFREEDAEFLIEEGFAAIKDSKSVPTFRFHGIVKGEGASELPTSKTEIQTKREFSNDNVVAKSFISVEVVRDISSKFSDKVNNTDRSQNLKLQVHLPDVSQLALRPKRISPGHGACPGCGIFTGLDQFFKGIEGDVVVLYHTGCAMVVTTGYPFSAHRVSYIHNLFQNGAPTLSGLVEAFHEKRRRKEIDISDDITFVMVTGDGGMDIGMGPTIGTALRNHHMIILEYDNQGYMNTGGQLSYTTPFGHKTVTSHVGKNSFGKHFHHKDTLRIMAATGIPYIFSAIESTGTDLIEKAAKAQWHAKNSGLVFGKLLVTCPLNWGSEERQGYHVLQKAVNSCFYPLYEIENDKTKLTYNPELEGKKIPVADWLAMMEKTKHLLNKDNAAVLANIQTEVDRRWSRLKAMAENDLL